MCGFLGRVGGGTDAHDLRAAQMWVARRGPDSQRLWQSADRSVELLFGRLAIVDRDPRADQPLRSPQSGVVIAMNGEIYNYLECRAQLSSYPFQTDSDTEVALAAYVTHGVAGLRMLKGMYAMVIVDEPQRRVLIARDPVGKKPLYIARWGRETLFGSSVLALVAAHGGGATIDATVCAPYWDEAFVPPTASALKGATPVLPGQVLELDWSGAVTREDSCEPAAALTYAGESSADVTANVGALLRMAIRRRLVGNPNPMSLLSGGIDSTVVTALAQEVGAEITGAEPLRALTLGAAVPGTNDEPFARYAGKRIGVPLVVMRPRQAGLPDTIARALDLQDEPLGMPSFFLLERLVTTASQYGRILLSGDGGDEVFLGYRPPADWRAPAGTPEARESTELRVGGALPSWMSDWARKVSTVTLLGHMLPKVDRASAEQGIELRCPLLDWDVVRYARSLPFDMLAGTGVTKSLLKNQLAGWPPRFLERQKRGFTYNLRWVWGARRYAGLREMVDARAIEAFASMLPAEMNRPPASWKSAHIFKHFSVAWRLLAWSRFVQRLDRASSTVAPRELARLSV